MNRSSIIYWLEKVKTPINFLDLLNMIKADADREKEQGSEDDKSDRNEKGVKEKAKKKRHWKFTTRQLSYYSDIRNTKRYTFTSIPKKHGGTRQIAAPTPTLKMMLRCVNVILEAYYNPKPCVKGFSKGRSIKENGLIHLNQNYVFNIDLSDFFPSITQGRVWACLKTEPFCFPDVVRDYIAKLATAEYPVKEGESKGKPKLPQGAPTSPILSNIVCRKLDRRLTGLAKRFGLHYSRYADDMTFSSMHNVYQEGSEFRKELRRIIEEQGFVINERKTRLQKRGSHQEVTGLTVGEKVNVSKAYIKELRSVLHVWERFGYADASMWLNSRYKAAHGFASTDEPVLEYVVGGKLNYLNMIKGDSDSTYKGLKARFDLLMSQLNGSRPEKKKDAGWYVISTYPINEFLEKTKRTQINLNVLPNGNVSGKLVISGVKTPVYFDKFFKSLDKEKKENVIKDIKSGKSRWFISEIESRDRINKRNVNHFMFISRYNLLEREREKQDIDVERLLDEWEQNGLESAVRLWKQAMAGGKLTPLEKPDSDGIKNTQESSDIGIEAIGSF